MGFAERKKLIEEIEKKRGSTVLCFLTSDRANLNVQMAKDVLPVFVEQLRALKPKDKIDVFIFTMGGDILTGFGLSRLLREYVKWVGVLVPEKCHSAGTLFALGANEILMTRGATLSPIDPSITRPLNPAVQLNPSIGPQLIPLSVESVAGYRALVSEDWKLQGEDSLVEAFKLLAEKVHPLALGDVYRTRQQIELLASRLLTQHRKEDGKVISEIVDILAKKLGSHDYLIYRTEAREILGPQIVSDDATEDLIWSLFLDYSKEMELGTQFTHELHLQKSGVKANPWPKPPQPGFITRQHTSRLKYVVVESTQRSDSFDEEFMLTEYINADCSGTAIAFKQLIVEWKRHH